MMRAIMTADPVGPRFCDSCQAMMNRVEKTLCKGCQSEMDSLNADYKRRESGIESLREEVRERMVTKGTVQ